MVKRHPKWLKIGVQSHFGPNFTVEFEAFFRKKNWPGLLHKYFNFHTFSFVLGGCFQRAMMVKRHLVVVEILGSAHQLPKGFSHPLLVPDTLPLLLPWGEVKPWPTTEEGRLTTLGTPDICKPPPQGSLHPSQTPPSQQVWPLAQLNAVSLQQSWHILQKCFFLQTHNQGLRQLFLTASCETSPPSS